MYNLYTENVYCNAPFQAKMAILKQKVCYFEREHIETKFDVTRSWEQQNKRGGCKISIHF
jgi:hypothetical protein